MNQAIANYMNPNNYKFLLKDGLPVSQMSIVAVSYPNLVCCPNMRAHSNL